MEEPFLFMAGHPALDFLNTEKANGAGERVELLFNPESVAAWFSAVGLGNVVPSDALLADARALRDAIRALVIAWTSDEADACTNRWRISTRFWRPARRGLS